MFVVHCATDNLAIIIIMLPAMMYYMQFPPTEPIMQVVTTTTWSSGAAPICSPFSYSKPELIGAGGFGQVWLVLILDVIYFIFVIPRFSSSEQNRV